MSKAEKFISDCTKKCSNELIAVESHAGKEVISYHEWLTPDQARRAVEIARAEIYEWLINHNDYIIAYIIANGSITRFDMEKCIKDLKQAMKDE